MNLEFVFKLSIYSMTAFSAWILGSAEEGWIPYATLPLVILGYFWSEAKTRRSSGMNETLASICAFIALTVSVNEFFGPDPAGKLLAGTHLLVYLTWVLLLQRKTNRRYWLLLAIGVLQLSLASVQVSSKSSIWFGVCSIIYFCAAIWTMSIFSLFRSATQFASAMQTGRELVESSESKSTHGIFAYDSVQSETGQITWTSNGFVSGVGFTSIAGLFVSAAFFALIPRVWVNSGVMSVDNSSVRREASKSGFTENVRLGDMGSILESMEPVLELQVYDAKTNTPISAGEYASRLGHAEPLFRGAVLSVYDSKSWKVDPQIVQKSDQFIRVTSSNMVRQDIHLRPIGTDVLFCMGNPSSLDRREREAIHAKYDWVTGLMRRPPEQSNRAVEYSVYSPIPSPETSANGFAEVHSVAARRLHEIGYIESNLTVPSKLHRLRELANKIVDDESRRLKRKLDDLEKARAIETYLRETGGYTYTINLSISDPKIDPVEDFLFNRKTGHCEYFASALVLMMRSVGVSARLVTGFKGGISDSGSNKLSIQQRHSHAWCEAWINNRAWVTLDATPAEARAASVEAVSSKRPFWLDLRAEIAAIWNDNVVNISLEKQEQAFYRPMREIVIWIAKIVKELWTSPDVGLETIRRLIIEPQNWFSFQGAATFFVVIATAWITLRLFRRAQIRWTHWRRKRSQAQMRRLVEFYERFSRLMQTCGLKRSETQTQQEFAREATETLGSKLESADGGPAEISDLFYRVRFGDEPLNEDEVRRTEELLSKMERQLLPAGTKK